MSINDFLCLATAQLMLMFGLGWGLAGQAIGLSRSASLGWAGYCLCCALTGFFSMEAAGLPEAVSLGLRNTCLTGALMLLRQGLLHFLNEQPRHREHFLLLTLVLLVSIADGAGLLMASLRVVVISVVMCWIVLACGAVCARPVRREFGLLLSASWYAR